MILVTPASTVFNNTTAEWIEKCMFYIYIHTKVYQNCLLILMHLEHLPDKRKSYMTTLKMCIKVGPFAVDLGI